MDHRAALALAMLSGAILIGSTFSCSAADPGTINFIERPKGQTGDLTSGGTSGVTPTDGGSSGDGGEAGADGGGSTSGAVVTAFTGAPAFNAAGVANGTSLNAGHNFAGDTVPVIPGVMLGQEVRSLDLPCLQLPADELHRLLDDVVRRDRLDLLWELLGLGGHDAQDGGHDDDENRLSAL